APCMREVAQSRIQDAFEPEDHIAHAGGDFELPAQPFRERDFFHHGLQPAFGAGVRSVQRTRERHDAIPDAITRPAEGDALPYEERLDPGADGMIFVAHRGPRVRSIPERYRRVWGHSPPDGHVPGPVGGVSEPRGTGSSAGLPAAQARYKS